MPEGKGEVLWTHLFPTKRIDVEAEYYKKERRYFSSTLRVWYLPLGNIMSPRTMNKLNPFQGRRGSYVWKTANYNIRDGCCMAGSTHTDAVPELSFTASIHLPVLDARWPNNPWQCTPSTLGWSKGLSAKSGATIAGLQFVQYVRVVSAWLSGWTVYRPLWWCDNWIQVTWKLDLQVIQVIS